MSEVVVAPGSLGMRVRLLTAAYSSFGWLGFVRMNATPGLGDLATNKNEFCGF